MSLKVKFNFIVDRNGLVLECSPIVIPLGLGRQYF